MPYFIFKVFPGKKLEPVTRFEKFQEAKDHAKEMRKQSSADDEYSVKVIFAKTDLEAQVLLKEEREYRPMGDD